MKRVLWMVIVAIVTWMSMTTVAQEVADTVVAVAEQVDTATGMSQSEEFQLSMRELDLEEMRLARRDFRQDFLPMVAILFSLLSPALIVFLFLFYKNKKEQSRYRVMEKAIESGRELPEGFFDEPNKKEATPSKSKMLHQGVVFTAVGAGLLLWGLVTSMVGSTTDIMKGVGFIFALVGIGKLIVYRLEARKGDTTENSDEQPQ